MNENRSPADAALSRRRFVGASLAGGVGLGLGTLLDPERALAACPASSDLRITRVTSLTVPSERWKVVGKNSQRGVHGKFARDRVLLIETGGGPRGVGSCFASREQAAALIGKDPLSFYRPGVGVVSPLGRGDAPLWDLVGRYFEQPVWRLLGGFGQERIPAYDGSIYFSDLQPEHASRGVARILEEVDHGLEQGHRAFKIKVGRGHKWMESAAGLKRDIEVVRAIRKHVGPDIDLMADANNGYDPATTRRFLDEADADLYFVEEMFPENVADDLALKAWLRSQGQATLVADGESARSPEHFRDFIAARALDVLQGDVRAFGFTALLELSRMAAGTGILLAPHNWGSYLGFLMQAVVGRGIPNFATAERDPGETDLFAGAEAFELRDGTVRVPDTPGLGLEVRLDTFLERHAVDWTLE